MACGAFVILFSGNLPASKRLMLIQKIVVGFIVMKSFLRQSLLLMQAGKMC